MSYWRDLAVEDKILEILDVQSHEPGHHFGRPFLTPYQIAIEFRRRFPQEFKLIGKPVGGKGTRRSDSLAQYIAGELSKRIRDGGLPSIEGRFLHRKDLLTLQYQDGEDIIESSAMQAYDLSMYRLAD